MQTPDYRFCTETVTVYTPIARQAVHRAVLPRCFLESTRGLRREAYGASRQVGAAAEEGFLLVAPLDKTGHALGGGPRWVAPVAFAALSEAERDGCFTLAPSGKLLPGEGPVLDFAGFASLVNAAADGLCTLGSVKAQRGPNGRILHLEGGA